MRISVGQLSFAKKVVLKSGKVTSDYFHEGGANYKDYGQKGGYT